MSQSSYVELLRRRHGSAATVAAPRKPPPPKGLPIALHLPDRAVRAQQRERANGDPPPSMRPGSGSLTFQPSRRGPRAAGASSYAAPEPFAEALGERTPALQCSDPARCRGATSAAGPVSATVASAASAAVRSAALRAEVDTRVNKAAIAALLRAKASSRNGERGRGAGACSTCGAGAAGADAAALSARQFCVGTQTAEAPSRGATAARSSCGGACTSSGARLGCRGCKEKEGEISRLASELSRSDVDWRRMVGLLEDELEIERGQVAVLEADLARHARLLPPPPPPAEDARARDYHAASVAEAGTGGSSLGGNHSCHQQAAAHASGASLAAQQQRAYPPQLPQHSTTRDESWLAPRQHGLSRDAELEAGHCCPAGGSAAEWRRKLQPEMPQLGRALHSPFTTQEEAAQPQQAQPRGHALEAPFYAEAAAAPRQQQQQQGSHRESTHPQHAPTQAQPRGHALEAPFYEAAAAPRQQQHQQQGSHREAAHPQQAPTQAQPRGHALEMPFYEAAAASRQQQQGSHREQHSSGGGRNEHDAPQRAWQPGDGRDWRPSTWGAAEPPPPPPPPPQATQHSTPSDRDPDARSRHSTAAPVHSPRVAGKEAPPSPGRCAASPHRRASLYQAPQRLCAWGTHASPGVASPPSSLARGRKPPFGCGRPRDACLDEPVRWPIQDSLSIVCVCARINHPFITPAHLHYLHY